MDDNRPNGLVFTNEPPFEGEKHPSVKPPGVSTEPSTDPNSGEDVILTNLIRSDYHLTARLPIHLEPKQLSLLLSVLNYLSVHFGVTFTRYVQSLHIYEILLGGKSSPTQVKDIFLRNELLVTQIILRSVAGKEFIPENPVYVDEQTKKLLLEVNAVISRDVYKSRLATWKPGKFVVLKTVLVDVYFERNNGKSERYSSYCKGYGEGSGTARTSKTRRCFELDGEELQEWVLGQQIVDQELHKEAFLVAHFEWLKRFGTEN